MQQQGKKIQEILKRKGLTQYLFVQGLGWNPTSFSRKVKEGEDFSTIKLQAIADALGIKREFLENKEIEYHRSKPIPADAIAEPTPEPAPPTPDPSDAATILARTQEAMVSKWPEVLRAVVRAEMEKVMLEIIELRATVDRLENKSNQP